MEAIIKTVATSAAQGCRIYYNRKPANYLSFLAMMLGTT